MRTIITRGLAGFAILVLIAAGPGVLGAGAIVGDEIARSPLPEVQAGIIGCPGANLPTPTQGVLLNANVGDLYCLAGVAGDVVMIQVDTIDPVTTHDPWLGLCPGRTKTFIGSPCAFFDDNFGCTFPPPAFSCPRGSVVLGTTGDYTIFVATWGVSGGLGPYGYELTVTVNGIPGMVDVNSRNQPL